ncbi:unnamed protein product, partial [Mesorhabditis belari]|uniref:Profilin n=1 Tax=Mesorhabditis belari TaxID=2138241 RepID=A0AAF3J931_9BILA
MSPELLRGANYHVKQEGPMPEISPKSDLYAVGLILWEIVEREKVFREYTTDYEFFMAMYLEVVKLGLPSCDVELRDIIMSCAEFDAQKRPSIQDLYSRVVQLNERYHGGDIDPEIRKDETKLLRPFGGKGDYPPDSREPRDSGNSTDSEKTVTPNKFLKITPYKRIDTPIPGRVNVAGQHQVLKIVKEIENKIHKPVVVNSVVTWDKYINHLTNSCNYIQRAAILGYPSGEVWARTREENLFKATKAELKALLSGFSDSAELTTRGVDLEKVHYLVIRANNEMIFGRTRFSGFLLLKTRTVALVAVYEARDWRDTDILVYGVLERLTRHLDTAGY